MWDNGERNVELDKAEFIDNSPLNGDPRFNMEAHRVEKNVKSLIE